MLLKQFVERILWFFEKKNNSRWGMKECRQYTYWEKKRAEWLTCEYFRPPKRCFYNNSFKDLCNCHSIMLNAIEYKRENLKDDWKPSDRTLKDGFGDCEDQAIYLLRLLACHGFNPNDSYILITEGHASVAYWHESNDFWLLDNGHLSWIIVKASEFFPRDNIVPLFFLNYYRLMQARRLK
jgi:hypothetical protein